MQKLRGFADHKFFCSLLVSGFSAHAQQPAEKKPLIETPTMRLAAAKNVFITRTHGSRIPLDVIRSTMEGWETVHFR